MRKRLHRWLLGGLVITAFLFGLRYLGSRTEAPVLSAGVTRETRRLSLAGREVAATLYYPTARAEAPVVIVVHGFTRTQRYMAGWGADLAAHGITALVLTQPALADHRLNARVLAEIAEKVRHGELNLRVRSNQKVGLTGFSMGGLTTLLAASQTLVDAWVGLDPVDMDGSGARAAAKLKVPSAVLCAEPEPWNLNGNARGLIAVLPKLKLALRVRHATHLDAESPTDRLGQLVCGFTRVEHQAAFKRYALAFLRATLLNDAESQRIIQGAPSDESLSDVVVR